MAEETVDPTIVTVLDRPRRHRSPNVPKPLALPTKRTTAHHMVRNLVSLPNPTDSFQISALQADRLVEEWLAKGYELFATHTIGLINMGPIIVWIFVK